MVNNVEALIEATKDASIRDIVITNSLVNTSSFRLSPGQSLRGADDGLSVVFDAGKDGLELSFDNRIQNISLVTSTDKRAIYNDINTQSLGRIEVKDVSITGRVQILMRNSVRGGHVQVDGLDIKAADARAEIERPHGYGVYVLQGAFTLWNMQPEDSAVLTADLTNISAGRPEAPVFGSGIFVSGGGDKGGRVILSRLETGSVYSDGKIAPGTPDQITGGVFTVYGAEVDLVRNRGPLVTYGTNDMVLDNWGTVNRWISEGKITSHGPSGIGFVNFGTINELRVEAPIETFGLGARGFNVYTGTVKYAEFDRIITHGDGAVGIQISQPIGRLIVRRGIETFGGTGQSLVKGIVTSLSAIGLSVKSGGSAEEIKVAGGVKTNRASIPPFENQGRIESIRVDGGLDAADSKPQS